jgi:hypothetical protein
VAATPASVSVLNSTFTYALSGLTAGQTIHYRAKGVGFFTVYGSDQSFKAAAPFGVTSISATVIHSGSNWGVTLKGHLDSLGQFANANGYFDYGYTTSYGTTVIATSPAQPMTAAGDFTWTINTGLSHPHNYNFRAKAVGSDGTTTVLGGNIAWSE